MSTDTPRTDQAAKILLSSFKEGFEQSSLWKSFDLCRTLERELAANAAELVRVRAERDGAVGLLTECSQYLDERLLSAFCSDLDERVRAALRAAVPAPAPAHP